MYSDSPLKTLIDRTINKIRELKQKYCHDNSPEQKDALKLVEAFEAIIINLSDLIAQRFDNQETSTILDFLRPNSFITLGKLVSPALTLKTLLFTDTDYRPLEKMNHPLLLELLMFLFFELRVEVPGSIGELVPFANPDIPAHFISSKESFASILNNPLVVKIASLFKLNRPLNYEMTEFVPDTALRSSHLHITFNADAPTTFHYKVKVSKAHTKYELALGPVRGAHTRNTIYLQSNNEHLMYEVIGSDGLVKTSTISWNSLPFELREDFPKDQSQLRDFQEKWLHTLLAYTSKANHTCVIEDTINLQDIPNLEYDGCNLLKNPPSLDIKSLNELGLTRNTLILFKDKLHYFDIRKQKIHTIKSTNDNQATINSLKRRFTEDLRTGHDDTLESISSLIGVTHLDLLPLTVSKLQTMMEETVMEITSARGHTHTVLSAMADNLMQINIERLRHWYLFSTEAPQGCGLIRMAQDPSQLGFAGIEGQLHNRSALIVFNDSLFYADKVARNVQPISYTNNDADFIHSITEIYSLANTDDLKGLFQLTGKNHSAERVGTIYLSLDAESNCLRYEIVNPDTAPENPPNQPVLQEGSIEVLETPLSAPLTMEQITRPLQEAILKITHDRGHTCEHSPYSYFFAFQDSFDQVDGQEFYHFFLQLAQEWLLSERALLPEIHRCIVKNPNAEFIKNEMRCSQILLKWMDQELAKLESEFPDPTPGQESSHRNCEARLERYRRVYSTATLGELLCDSNLSLTLEDLVYLDMQRPLSNVFAFRQLRMNIGFAIVSEEEKHNYCRPLTQAEYVLTRAKECGFIRMTRNPKEVSFEDIESSLEKENTVILFKENLYYADKQARTIASLPLVKDKRKEFRMLQSKFKPTYQNASYEILILIQNVTESPRFKQCLYFIDRSAPLQFVRISLKPNQLMKLNDYIFAQFNGLINETNVYVPSLSAEHQAEITTITDYAAGETILVPILNKLIQLIEKKLTLYKEFQASVDGRSYVNAHNGDQTFFLSTSLDSTDTTLRTSCSSAQPSGDSVIKNST